MRLYKFISLLLLGGLLPGITVAKEITVVIKLMDIKAERTAEKNGDELYFDVTQYPDSGKPMKERIPITPLRWKSNQLSQVKDILLWEGNIATEENIKLILSLVEEELPPWDVDDLLGSAQLVLTNDKGTLKQRWSIPNFEKSELVEMQKKGAIQRYIFKGQGSRYDVGFQVEQK